MDKKNEIDDKKSDAELQKKQAKATKRRRRTLWMAAALIYSGRS